MWGKALFFARQQRTDVAQCEADSLQHCLVLGAESGSGGLIKYASASLYCLCYGNGKHAVDNNCLCLREKERERTSLSNMIVFYCNMHRYAQEMRCQCVPCIQWLWSPLHSLIEGHMLSELFLVQINNEVSCSRIIIFIVTLIYFVIFPQLFFARLMTLRFWIPLRVVKAEKHTHKINFKKS